MQSFLQMITFLSVILTVSSAPVVDCTSVTSMVNGLKQCFTDNGIELNLPTGISEAEMASVVQTDAILYNLTTTCIPDNLPKYKSGLRCAIDVIRPCLRRTGIGLDKFLPSPSQLDQAQDYLCANKDKFNATCVTSKSIKTEVKACATERARKMIHRGMNVTEAGCIGANFIVPCTREKTAKCGSKSSATYTEMNRILIPKMCDAYPVSGVITTVSSAPVVDCTSVSSLLNGVRQCFTDNSIELNLPTGISEAEMAGVVQTDATLYNLTTTCMPDNLPKYKSSLRCAIDVFRLYLRQAGKTLDRFLPSPSQLDQAQDYLCTNKENFNAKCVTSKNIKTDVIACATERARNVIRRGMSVTQARCLGASFVVPCTREKTAKCGTKSSKTYTEMNRILIPKICDAYSVSRGACHFSLASPLLVVIFLFQCISSRF